jgi:hypothetical protein
MRVLVLGGSGFIGPRVMRLLLERGHEVHCMDIAPDAPSLEELFLVGWSRVPSSAESTTATSERPPDAISVLWPHRGQATLIYFINDTDETVGLHITGDGGEMEFVRSLDPDDAHVQITTVGTGWIVTDADGECLGGGLPRDPGGANVFINPVAPRPQ